MKLIHWRDETGILCGAPLGIAVHALHSWRPGLRSTVVDCIDCKTIAALVEEAQDETEATETLLRERTRYAARR